MKEFKLPSLGEGIEKGTVISIMVKVGDKITAEQPLLEVETDKVVVEVPADSEGVIISILVNEGDEVSEGMPIIHISLNEEESNVEVNTVVTQENSNEITVKQELRKAPEKDIEAVSQEMKLPSLGEGIEKGTVISITVKEGDTITAEQSLLEVETDKVVVEVPSNTDGTVTKILVAIGDEVSVGTPIFQISSENGALADNYKETESTTATEIVKQPLPEQAMKQPEVEVLVKEKTVTSIVTSQRKGRFRASPLAKKIAREIGIDIASMPINGHNKRISVQDVKDYAKMLNQNRGSGGMAVATAPLPDFSKWGSIHTKPMPGIMQATSKNMTICWSQVPHAWLQEKIDITYLEDKRQKHKAEIKTKGGSLTITGILVKVMAKALEDFPIFNASIDSANATIIYKDYINIGVAVDTDRGLLVPVLKDANEKDITSIALELNELATKVKQKKITGEELNGATFTISNLGGIGTSAIFPLVTFPQVAILGVAASQIEAVYIDGKFQPRLMMPLTIGFDHRIINGADAARFLKHVKTLLEDWFGWNL